MTGNITLEWSAVQYAAAYEIYRSLNTIPSIDSEIPLMTTTARTYEDLSLSNGTYYYVIVAKNNYRSRPISNEKSVEVGIPPEEPTEPTGPSGKIGLIVGLTVGGAVVIGARTFFGVMFKEQIATFLKKLRK